MGLRRAALVGLLAASCASGDPLDAGGRLDDGGVDAGGVDAGGVDGGGVDAGPGPCLPGGCPDGERCDEAAGACEPDPCSACGMGTLCRGDACELDVDGDGYTTMTDGDCDDSRPDVHPGAAEGCDVVDRDCDGDPAEGCPCPSVTRESHVYLLCDDPVDWTRARDRCRDVPGFDLLTVETADEDAWITARVRDVANEHWWFGLNDRDREGHFVWASGSDADYRNWSSDQPDDYGGDEDCGHLNRTRTDDRKWNDLPCSTRERFVCESL